MEKNSHHHFGKKKGNVSPGLDFGEWIKQVMLEIEVTSGRGYSGGIGSRKWRLEEMEPRMKGTVTPVLVRS